MTSSGSGRPLGATTTAGARRSRGYLMVGSTAVMFGATGVWVGMTDLPVSTVLVMRMGLAAVMVALLGGGRRWLRQALRPGVLRRLLLLGVIDALQLYTFMLALRRLDVALAVFLSYMSPIYIALIAPRLLKQRTEPVVVVALVLAVSGIAAMLAPGLFEPGLRAAPDGIALGLVSGLVLAVFFLLATALSAQQLDRKIAFWILSMARSHLGAAALMMFGASAALSMWISNTATALILAPIAIAIASETGVSPVPLLMSVAIAAAASFLTPVATAANTMVIAASVSNGGAAVLRAAEQDTAGLIDGVVAGEPSAQPSSTSGYGVQFGGVDVGGFGKPLMDYFTIANLYQPCAALAPSAALTEVSIYNYIGLTAQPVGQCIWKI